MATLCLVNRERTSRGERALRPDVQLQVAAQGHSADMAAGDYFQHDGRHGDTPLSRMRAVGYIFSSHIGYALGENIAWATLWLASPKAIVASWMASPGHRANILDATFVDTGIGVSPHPLASLAHGQAGAIYTQDFGRIIRPSGRFARAARGRRAPAAAHTRPRGTPPRARRLAPATTGRSQALG